MSVPKRSGFAALFVIASALAVCARLSAADDAKKVTLDTVLPNASFDGVALSDAIAFVHDITDLTIDWKAMEDAGIKPDAQVRLKVSNKKLGDVIREVFKAAGATEAPQVTLEEKTVVVKPAKKKVE